jgi:hypothetical protein
MEEMMMMLKKEGGIKVYIYTDDDVLWDLYIPI